MAGSPRFIFIPIHKLRSTIVRIHGPSVLLGVAWAPYKKCAICLHGLLFSLSLSLSLSLLDYSAAAYIPEFLVIPAPLLPAHPHNPPIVSLSVETYISLPTFFLSAAAYSLPATYIRGASSGTVFSISFHLPVTLSRPDKVLRVAAPRATATRSFIKSGNGRDNAAEKNLLSYVSRGRQMNWFLFFCFVFLFCRRECVPVIVFCNWKVYLATLSCFDTLIAHAICPMGAKYSSISIRCCSSTKYNGV